MRNLKPKPVRPLSSFSHWHMRYIIFIKIHNIESRCAIGPDKSYHCLQVRPCIFKHGNFTVKGLAGKLFLYSVNRAADGPYYTDTAEPSDGN